MATALDQWPVVGRYEELERFEAALADPTCQGLVLHGASGVGKSRLADECRAVAAEGGATVAVAVASATAAHLPLGAIAHLVPPIDDGGVFDPVRLFDRVRDDLEQRLGAERLVLSVDDVHLLDVASATLVSQLLAEGLAFLLGTVRTGEPVPDAVSALWRSGKVVRVDLGPLDRVQVDTMLHLALGGPVAANVTGRMWESSQGSPLFVRELVLEAIDSGLLAFEDGAWRCEQPLTGGRRLAEVVQDRIAGLDDAGRTVLDLLALCQPVGLHDLERHASLAVLEELETSGLVEVRADRRRQEVALAHPLYAEVLRGAMPRLRARRVLLAHAERVEAHGLRRRTDPLRIATWRLDAEGHADPGLLVQGARVARGAHDFRQVARLARAALAGESEVLLAADASILLGEALYELGEFDEAEAVMAAAAPLPGLDEYRQLLLVTTRGKNLFWGKCDTEAALSVNLAGQQRIGVAGRAELIAEEGSIRGFSGDPRGAMEMLDGLGPLEGARERVLRALPLAPALAMIGRTSEAITVAQEGFAAHAELGDALAVAHPGTHVVNQVFALTEAGRLDEAVALGRAGYEVTVADSVPIAQVWFALNVARASVQQGAVATALGWYREGAETARAHHFVGPLRLALAGLALSHILVGEPTTARAVLDEYERLGPFPFLRQEQATPFAWLAAAEGDPARARAVLTEAATDAEATGHLVSAALLLHDASRLGQGGLAQRLADLAAECESDLVAARVLHVQATDAGDSAAMVDALERFEAIGARLLAAEAAIAAAGLARRDGDQRRAAALDRRAEEHIAACEGARTPGLARSDAVVPLSKREREVALLAADGLASKDIATRLFLSVRTVDNHLQRAYTKLGVSGRAALASALGAPPGDGAGGGGR